jgi:tetratricopeptide (TPR) repeat protein
MTRPAALFAIASLAALCSACAPEGLSSRYRIEEAFWDAERYRDAFSGRPGIPTARGEIEGRYRRILARFPAAPSDAVRREACWASVNGLRGLARLALGRSALAAGEVDVAEEAFRTLLVEAPARTPLAAEARVGLAQTAETAGDRALAFAVYESLLTEATPGRGLTAASLASFFPIPLYLAERRAALGDPAGAESSLALGARVIAPFRAATEDSAVRETAGAWLTEILLTRGAWSEAVSLLEERAAAVGARSGRALLALAARVALDAGRAPDARRLLSAARARGDTAPSPAEARIEAELLVAEGETAAGEQALAALFESGSGVEEEAARAGIALGDLAASRGEWGSAAEAYGRVESRYPLTEARIDAGVARARILDDRVVEGGWAREATARDLTDLAKVHPGIRRSERAEDGAVLLLGEAGAWEELLALLEEIADGFGASERGAAALVRAAVVARDRIGDEPRAAAYLARATREFPGTIGAHQAALLAASPTSSETQEKP